MEFTSSILFIFFGLFAGLLLEKFKSKFFKGVGKIILVCLCAVSFILAAMFHIKSVHDNAGALSKLPVFVGVIYPSDDISSLSMVDNDQKIILLGDHLRLIVDKGNNSVFVKDGKAFLNLNTNSDGSIVLSAKITDSNNNKIVSVIDNEFQASHDFSFLPKQPDKHSLIVRDSDGIEVLNIKFINQQTIRLTGRFILPGEAEPVVISADSGIHFPGGGGITDLTWDMRGNGSFLDFSSPNFIKI